MDAAVSPRSFLSHISPSILIAGHICWYCLRPFTDLSTGQSRLNRATCSGCKRAWYCSKECQKNDWRIEHKALCKAFQGANKRDRTMGHDASATRKERMFCRDICSNAFSIPTINDEYGTFPLAYISQEIKCAVCLRTPFHSEVYFNMNSCPTCKLAWWCSPECGEQFSVYHTPKLCAHMSDVEAVEHLTIAYALARRTSRQFMQRSHVPRSSYLPLSELRGWAEYGRLFPDFEYSVHMNAREFQHVHPSAEKAIALMAKEAASVTLTILAALEDTVPDLSRRTRLCIHIAGAAHRELTCSGLMEELLHFLPCLEHVTVVYTGPEITLPPSPQNLACVKCQNRGWSRTSVFHEGSYADFDDEAHPPDLIAVLNSGFTEMETGGWQASLRVILDSGKPALFTAYSQMEAEWEEKTMKDTGARVVRSTELNKWQGLSPTVPKERSTLDSIVFTYSNQFRFIIQGRV
ncbi:uncharacterized protein EV420DRAFT_816754 [Desarmillaria tabescens]|uniref:MYND-type domain-containing protein n=1 Tax=Armillaria tabescens TaxID=1929756 RepID=A0AA39NIE8_ARMTA|nr:uncharacterized protein EV420DRAFT_816754 [Desarmillaria tabescens]KAK0466216.1 hypothetical protein EV420DRAFT_816754 [Desarmillaria tabescens]